MSGSIRVLCWWRLVDDDGNAESMFEFNVPSKSVDVGSETINGVTAEHWHFKGYFPIEQVDDMWFAANGESHLRAQHSLCTVPRALLYFKSCCVQLQNG